MYDVSDRFLHQLAAERRESLLRSGRASTRRPLRQALRAGLARLGLASCGVSGTAGLPLDQTQPTLASTEEPRCVRDPWTGPPRDVGDGSSTTRLGRVARQAYAAACSHDGSTRSSCSWPKG